MRSERLSFATKIHDILERKRVEKSIHHVDGCFRIRKDRNFSMSRLTIRKSSMDVSLYRSFGEDLCPHLSRCGYMISCTRARQGTYSYSTSGAWGMASSSTGAPCSNRHRSPRLQTSCCTASVVTTVCCNSLLSQQSRREELKLSERQVPALLFAVGALLLGRLLSCSSTLSLS